MDSDSDGANESTPLRRGRSQMNDATGSKRKKDVENEEDTEKFNTKIMRMEPSGENEDDQEVGSYDEEDGEDVEGESDSEEEEGDETDDEDDEEEEDSDEEGDEEDGETEEEGSDWETDEDASEESEEEAYEEGVAVAVDVDEESDGESEKCPVCLDRLEEQNIGTPESCDHNFCLECILQWSNNVNTCPVDRQVFHLILARHSLDGVVYKRIPIADKSLEHEDEEDSTACEICGHSDREDRMLLCDGCDAGYHLECLTPPLRSVPVEEWFCPECAQHNHDVADNGIAYIPVRRIARTRISERVREQIEIIRSQRAGRRPIIEDSDEDIEEEGINSDDENVTYTLPELTQPSTSTRTSTTPARKKVTRRKTTRKKTTRRKTTKRKVGTKKKTTRKRTTKKKTTKKTGTKKKAGKKRKTRRRKKGRKLKRKSSARLKAPTPTTVKTRLAGRLGLSKPPQGRSIPLVRNQQERSMDMQRADIGVSALCIMGDKNELDGWVESNTQEVAANENRLLAKYSKSALLSRRPIRAVAKALNNKKKPKTNAATEKTQNGAPFDLLGSILEDQSVLHLKSKDVQIHRDGSLKPRIPIELPSVCPEPVEIDVRAVTVIKQEEKPETSSKQPSENVTDAQNIDSSQESPASDLVTDTSLKCENEAGEQNIENEEANFLQDTVDDMNDYNMADNKISDLDECNSEKNSDNDGQKCDNATSNTELNADNSDSNDVLENAMSLGDTRVVVRAEEEKNEIICRKDDFAENPIENECSDNSRESTLSKEEEKDIAMDGDDHVTVANAKNTKQEDSVLESNAESSKNTGASEDSDLIKTEEGEVLSDGEYHTIDYGSDGEPFHSPPKVPISELPRIPKLKRDKARSDLQCAEDSQDSQESTSRRESSKDREKPRRVESTEGSDSDRKDRGRDRREKSNGPKHKKRRRSRSKSRKRSRERSKEKSHRSRERSKSRERSDKRKDDKDRRRDKYDIWSSRRRSRSRSRSPRNRSRDNTSRFSKDKEELTKTGASSKSGNKKYTLEITVANDLMGKVAEKKETKEQTGKSTSKNTTGIDRHEKKHVLPSVVEKVEKKLDTPKLSETSKSDSKDSKMDVNTKDKVIHSKESKEIKTSESPLHSKDSKEKKSSDPIIDMFADDKQSNTKASSNNSVKEPVPPPIQKPRVQVGDNVLKEEKDLKSNANISEMDSSFSAALYDPDRPTDSPQSEPPPQTEPEPPFPFFSGQQLQFPPPGMIPVTTPSPNPNPSPMSLVDHNELEDAVVLQGEGGGVLNLVQQPPPNLQNLQVPQLRFLPPGVHPAALRHPVMMNHPLLLNGPPGFGPRILPAHVALQMNAQLNARNMLLQNMRMGHPVSHEGLQRMPGVPEGIPRLAFEPPVTTIGQALFPPDISPDVANNLPPSGPPGPIPPQGPPPEFNIASLIQTRPPGLGLLGPPPGPPPPHMGDSHPRPPEPSPQGPPPPIHISQVPLPPNTPPPTSLHQGPVMHIPTSHPQGLPPTAMSNSLPHQGLQLPPHTAPHSMQPPPSALVQIEAIGKLLDTQATLAKLQPNSNLQHGDTAGQGIFKIPLPPNKTGNAPNKLGQNGGQKTKTGSQKETTEVVDMDMGSPLDEVSFSPPEEMPFSGVSSQKDDIPTSAVELDKQQKFMKKLNRQERVVEEVKLAIKPFYSSKKINKEEYKEIMRKAVPKICHSKSGDINPMKIKALVDAYVQKFRKAKKQDHGKKQSASKNNGLNQKQKTKR